MTQSEIDPHELPLRARIGYVLKYSTVKQGTLNPSLVFFIMERQGLANYDDAESTIPLIKEVMKHSSHVEWGDDDDD